MTDTNYEIYLQYVAKQTLFLGSKGGRRIINRRNTVRYVTAKWE